MKPTRLTWLPALGGAVLLLYTHSVSNRLEKHQQDSKEGMSWATLLCNGQAKGLAV